MPTEEERALLYRQQRAARCQAKRDNLIALAGDREARDALEQAWQPPLLARLEAQAPVDPLLDDCLVELPQSVLYP